MKIGKSGLELIKKFEGCKLRAYKCPAGVWTIGWGHTGDVYEGQTITQDQADRLLEYDMGKYEEKVEKYEETYHWNQNEFDALVSFAYNVGSIDQLTAKGARSRDVIADKLLLYNRGGGQVLAGLTKRRKAERELFLLPIEETAQLGWIKCGAKYVYRISEGVNAHGWKLINHHWYYFDANGWMLTGWQKIESKWYYLEESGDYEGACWHEAADHSGELERWYVE